MGAFEDLYKAKKKNNKNKIGFINNSDFDENDTVLTNQDFINYGMPAEFLGRIGTVTYTKEFTLENLLDILSTSVISPIKGEIEFFEGLGIETFFTPDYYNEIALKSLKAKTGARDLKKMYMNHLDQLMMKL